MPDARYDIGLFREIQDELYEEFMDFILELAEDSVGPDGETYGDQVMTPGDRIAQFILDAQTGALDALKDLNPTHYERRVRQYQQDIRNSPFVAHTYEG